MLSENDTKAIAEQLVISGDLLQVQCVLSTASFFLLAPVTLCFVCMCLRGPGRLFDHYQDDGSLTSVGQDGSLAPRVEDGAAAHYSLLVQDEEVSDG